MGIYRKGKNPARELYRYWSLSLDARDSTGWVSPGASPTDTAISWGDVSGRRRSINFAYHHGDRWSWTCTLLNLSANGTFTLNPSYRNRHRSVLVSSTFLSYSHIASQRGWFVDTKHTSVNDWDTQTLNQVDNQIPYVDEWVFRRNGGATFKLLPDNGDWKIAPHKSPAYVHPGNLTKHFELNAGLRERRYRLRAARVTDADRPVKPKRHLLNAAGNPISDFDAALRISALLEPEAPTHQATRMKRTINF